MNNYREPDYKQLYLELLAQNKKRDQELKQKEIEKKNKEPGFWMGFWPFC